MGSTRSFSDDETTESAGIFIQAISHNKSADTSLKLHFTNAAKFLNTDPIVSFSLPLSIVYYLNEI